MKTLTDKESSEWCRIRGLKIDPHRRVYSLTSRRVFDITKVSPNRAVYIGYALVVEGSTSITENKSGAFHGGLVWILDYEVGDYPVARKMLERITLSYGATGFSMETLGHHFNQNEEVDAALFVTMLLLFHWEGYFIAEDGGYMFWIDDDEAIVLAGVDKRCDGIINELQKYYEVKEVDAENYWYKFICCA